MIIINNLFSMFLRFWGGWEAKLQISLFLEFNKFTNKINKQTIMKLICCCEQVGCSGLSSEGSGDDQVLSLPIYCIMY